MSIGKRLKRARQLRNMHQNQAARALGISPPTLAGYENDYRKPDIQTLAKLASLYEISVDSLLYNSDDQLSKLDTIEKVELRNILQDVHLELDGIPLTNDEKEQINDVITNLFWNKRREKSDPLQSDSKDAK